MRPQESLLPPPPPQMLPPPQMGAPPPQMGAPKNSKLPYLVIAILVLVVIGLIFYLLIQPSDECPAPTECPDAPNCPDCEECPAAPECPDAPECEDCPTPPPCPDCPDCAPTRKIKWTRYPATNGVWGLGGMPANDTTLDVDLPAGVKLYGRYGDADRCEQACMDDQPFCRSWAQSPNVPGSPWSNTCYGLDERHFRAHYEPNSMAGARSYVL